MKYCKACDSMKNESEFGKCKPDLVKRSDLDGLQYTCKECRKFKCKKSYEKVGRTYHKERYRNSVDYIVDKPKLNLQEYSQTEHYKLIRAAIKHKRRTDEYNNGGNFTVEEVLILFDIQNGKCVYCDCELEKLGKQRFHCDHIQPVSKGGTSWISNIQLLCPHCNLSKGNKTHEEFLQYIKYKFDK